MSLLETKLLLRKHKILPKKLLGQNFLVAPSVFQRMSDYASLNQNDVVLDIGAGFGFLTRYLASNCKSVIAIELDARIVKVLREQLKDFRNVKIVMNNALKVPIHSFNKVVSVPPYNISSRLILWLLTQKFDCAVLIFQKEFANRLNAPVGTNEYGWLTVLTYHKAKVEFLDAISRRMFYPQPKVDSLIIRLKPRKLSPFQLKNEFLFNQMVRALFTERNKKVSNAIIPFIKRKGIVNKEYITKLTKTLPFHNKRVRDLIPNDFGVFANALSDQKIFW